MSIVLQIKVYRVYNYFIYYYLILLNNKYIILIIIIIYFKLLRNSKSKCVSPVRRSIPDDIVNIDLAPDSRVTKTATVRWNYYGNNGTYYSTRYTRAIIRFITGVPSFVQTRRCPHCNRSKLFRRLRQKNTHCAGWIHGCCENDERPVRRLKKIVKHAVRCDLKTKHRNTLSKITNTSKRKR